MSTAARRYFYHATTGDKGFLVEVDGQQFIQYDRGAKVNERVPYREGQWREEVDHKPLTKFQIGQLAYECDLALRRIARVGPRDPKEWLALRDGERSAWTENGPPKADTERRMMFELVQAFGRTFAK